MESFGLCSGLCLKDELDIAWVEGDWLADRHTTGERERERERSLPQKVCRVARWAEGNRFILWSNYAGLCECHAISAGIHLDIEPDRKMNPFPSLKVKSYTVNECVRNFCVDPSMFARQRGKKDYLYMLRSGFPAEEREGNTTHAHPNQMKQENTHF